MQRVKSLPAWSISLIWQLALLASLAAIPAAAQPLSGTLVFGAATIPVGGTTFMQINLTNPSGFQNFVNITFTDTLPAGLVVATPNGLGGTCGGTITAIAGSNSVAVTGTAITAGNSCSIIVNVKGVSAGLQTNTTSMIGYTVPLSFTGMIDPLIGTITVTPLSTSPAPASLLLAVIGLLAILAWATWPWSRASQ